MAVEYPARVSILLVDVLEQRIDCLTGESGVLKHGFIKPHRRESQAVAFEVRAWRKQSGLWIPGTFQSPVNSTRAGKRVTPEAAG